MTTVYKIINRKKLFATVIGDTLGRILFFPKKLLGRPQPVNPGEIHKICIIKTAYIGDVVMTLPMLAPLRKLFPDAEITFLTSSSAAPLLRNNPYINRIEIFDPFWFYPVPMLTWFTFLKKAGSMAYDLVIETRGDIREIALLVFWMQSKVKVSYDIGGGGYLLSHVVPYPGVRHKVDYHIDIIKYLGGSDISVSTAPGINLTPDEHREMGIFLKEKGVTGPFIAVHPGARLKAKRWPHERFARLCSLLSTHCQLPVVLPGSLQEKELVAAIHALAPENTIPVAGELNIRQLAALLSRAAVMVCNDSAPMHIAAAMKTPVVAIFGPSKKEETAPYATQSIVIDKDFSCRPSCDENSCRQPVKQACMQAIEVEEVFHAVQRLLNKTQKTAPAST